LLEYAEEVLFCNHVIVYFKKNRADQRESTLLLLGYSFHLIEPSLLTFSVTDCKLLWLLVLA